MAYLAVKKVKGKYYAYKQESYREGGKVRTRTVEYLGAIEPAIAKQIQTTKTKVGAVEIDSLVDSIRQQAQTATKNSRSPKVNRTPPTPIKEPEKAAETKAQIQVNDSPALVNTETGELLKTYDRVITTDKNPSRPFSQSLKLPKDLEKYGISETALLRTHARYGNRLKDLGMNPSYMPDVQIKYGHPDRLDRSKNGFVVYVSRRTQNKRNKSNKTQLWKHYRQALSSAYLEAIEQGRPDLYHDLTIELDHSHKEAKKLLFDSIKYSAKAGTKTGLSLQLYLWDKIPKSVQAKSNPEDFGQVDFSTVNDWRAETTIILSEAQKSGWDGLINRQKSARRKAKSAITKKKNQLRDAGFFERVKNKLSGKHRRIIREIMSKEKQLQSIDRLDDRIKAIRKHLSF